MSTKKSGLEKARGAGRRVIVATVVMASTTTRTLMKSVRTARLMQMYICSLERGTGNFNAADMCSDCLVPINGCSEMAVDTNTSVIASVAAFTLLLADTLRKLRRVRLDLSTSPRHLGSPSKKDLVSTSRFRALFSSFWVSNSSFSSFKRRTISLLRQEILF